MLVPDGGTTLRQELERAPELGRWERVLGQHAAAQRALVPRAQDMIDLGVQDLRPATLPERVAALLEGDAAMMLDQPGGMTGAERDRMRRALERLPEQCAALSGAGIGSSLQHDDLHDGNVLVSAGKTVVFDWGDAYVGHPFAVLLITLRHIAEHPGLAAGPADLQRLRDAYLEPWTADASLSDLRALVPLAMRVGTLARALTWHRILDGIPAADRAEHAAYVPGWLLEYLLDPDPFIAQL